MKRSTLNPSIYLAQSVRRSSIAQRIENLTNEKKAASRHRSAKSLERLASKAAKDDLERSRRLYGRIKGRSILDYT